MICFWVRLKRALKRETGTETPTAFKPPSAKIEDERRKKRGGGRGGGGQKARRSESDAARLPPPFLSRKPAPCPTAWSGFRPCQPRKDVRPNSQAQFASPTAPSNCAICSICAICAIRAICTIHTICAVRANCAVCATEPYNSRSLLFLRHVPSVSR